MRIFLAFELPARLRDEVAAISSRARDVLPAARWSRAANLHLTLHFFGERSGRDVSAIAAALGPVLAAASPLSLVLDACGSFPPSRPRVLWLGVREATGNTLALESVHRAIQGTLAEIGEETDPRPFRPHLTIARCKGRWRTEHVERAAELYSPLAGAGFDARAATLISSELRPEGALYRSLAELPLAADEAAGEAPSATSDDT